MGPGVRAPALTQDFSATCRAVGATPLRSCPVRPGHRTTLGGDRKGRTRERVKKRAEALTGSKEGGQEKDTSPGAGAPLPPAVSRALWFRTLALILWARTVPFPVEDDDRIRDNQEDE